jgi:CubicO group peptidase (beta-lactamase class C family)
MAVGLALAQAPSPSPAPSIPPSPSPSPAVADGLPAEKAAAVEALLTSAMTRLGIPGLSAAIVTERRLRWSNAYGIADIENSVPAKKETVFRLASVTKPITATAVLQLVEAGKVDLDAPIQRYVPAFPEKQWPVTVRHLLSHQSGIRNWTDEEFHNTRHFATVAESLAVFKDDPLLFEPGSRTEYTSLGYNLMGAVVEGVSGKPFLEYLHERVFVPAGMSSARGDDVLAIIPNRAAGYQVTAAGELRNSPMSDTSNRTAGGGLVATAEDVARFAIAFQRGTLLKPSTVQASYGRQRTRDRRMTGYGLGWIVGQAAPSREVYHTGGQPRVSTVLYMVPRSGLAVVLLCNLEGVSTPLLDLARQMAGALLP